MIRITVNGEPLELNDTVSVTALLELRGQRAGVAVAINGEFVPKSMHGDRILAEGDQVEIVAPMQGG